MKWNNQLYKRIFKYGFYATMYEEGASFKTIKYLYFITAFLYACIMTVLTIGYFKTEIRQMEIVYIVLLSITILFFVIFSIRFWYQIPRIASERIKQAKLERKKEKEREEEEHSEDYYMSE